MDPRPKHFNSWHHEVIATFLICMAQFLCQASITMSLSTMNIVLESFGSHDSSKQVWFMGSFALTVGTFILVLGKLGDIFGLKFIFLIGWIWCTLSSLLIGFSVYVDVTFYIVCRALQGIGFALILPCGLGLLGTIYDKNSRKNLIFGLMGVNGPAGATIGAIISAVIAQLWWWPWCFWLLSIVCLIFGLLSWFYIPDVNQGGIIIEDKTVETKETPDLQSFDVINFNSRYPSTTKETNSNRTSSNSVNSVSTGSSDKSISFDYLGTILGISGLILFNFIWNQGPVAGWGQIYIIVLTIVAVILIIGFFYVELKVAKDPLLPRSIFNLKIGLVLLCIGLGWGSFGIWQFYYWQFLLNLRQYTPIHAGLTYIPFLVGGTVASLLVSVIISMTKPSYIIAFSSLCFMSGCLMLAKSPIDQSYFQITFGQQIILCWAMDLSFPAAAIVLSDYLPIQHQGMAGSLVSTVVNYSVSLFLGVGSVVELQTMRHVKDIWKSHQAALYFGTGVAGVGVLFSLVFIGIQRNDNVGVFEQAEYLDEKHGLLAELERQTSRLIA